MNTERATKEDRDEAPHHVTLNSRIRSVGRSPPANVSQAGKNPGINLLTAQVKAAQYMYWTCALLSVTKRAKLVVR